VLGHNFTLHNLQVPITLTGITPLSDPTNGCAILHLSLQIPDLNLLGLHVQLDNCNNGPVTVDVTAIPTGQPGGGLLGDLLCGLVDNNSLLDLTQLTSAQLGQLTDALNQVLGQILGGMPLAGGASPAQQGGGHGHGHGHRCDLINLEIPEGIHLNVLGLDVQTSAICLDVFAQRNGPGGGLLGSLLCSVDHLLAGHGHIGNLANELTAILALLNGLNL
jgi:hypothetical protein